MQLLCCATQHNYCASQHIPYLLYLRGRRRVIIRSLHDTITRLSSFRDREMAPLPAAARRLTKLGKFGSNPGALRGKTYGPQSFVKGSPLIVVLHGCTQSPESYDHGAGWSIAAEEHGFALLFPEQQRKNNPNLCFNWFSDADAGRDRGEAQSIRQMVAEMQLRFGTDPARVFVTGLSAGGAMAAVLLASYPEVFAGGGIIAGLPFGTAHSVPQAFDRMRGHGGPAGNALPELVRAASDHSGPWPRLSVWHGSGDMTVNPSNAQALIDQWGALHEVGQSPTRIDEVAGYPHRIWFDPAGREVIEEYSITGMAHGTPLDTLQGETGEIAGAYMLEAGISSTRQLLKFWGLAARATGAKHVRRSSPEGHGHRRAWREQRADNRIGRTIEDALRTAGLLR